jgi:hypothetical protein
MFRIHEVGDGDDYDSVSVNAMSVYGFRFEMRERGRQTGGGKRKRV